MLHLLRLEELFNMVEFLLHLGLRLTETPDEFQHSWVLERVIDGEIVVSPHWTRWPWEVGDGKLDSTFWVNDIFVANSITFCYYIKRACVQLDGPNWIDNPMEIVSTANFHLKGYHLGVFGLPRPELADCGCC